MDKLYEKFFELLNNDSTLGDLVSSVRFFRRPEDPQRLAKPVVIFNPGGGIDEIDLHGAAVNPRIDIEIWGYQHKGVDMAPDCIRAAQRISELLISSRLSLSRGGHVRWTEDQGYRMIEQEDPDEILFRATYSTRYWSGGRIDAIISSS